MKRGKVGATNRRVSAGTSLSRSRGRSLCRCGWFAAPPWSSPMKGGRRRSPGASWETAACSQCPARNPRVCSILGRDRRGQIEDGSDLDTRMLFLRPGIRRQDACCCFDDYPHFSSFRRTVTTLLACQLFTVADTSGITTPHPGRMCPANEIAALLLECNPHYPVSVWPVVCGLRFVPGQAVIMCNSHIFALSPNL